MKTGSAILVCLAVLCLSFPSSGKQRSIVAVFGIHDQGEDFDEELLHSLTEYLAASVAECRAYRLVPPWNLEPILGQKKLDSGSECFDPECQAELAAQLMTDLYISTILTSAADQCTMVSTLHDLERQTQLISARAQGECTELGLVRAIDDLAYFFVLWGGCRPTSVESQEVTENPYLQGRPPAVKERRLPELEEVVGWEEGSIPDVLVALGWNAVDRELSRPYHKSGVGHGIRMNVRLFMNTFFDIPGLRDFGVAGMYTASTGFEYGIDNYGGSVDGSISHWQVEMLYRMAFNNVMTRPAVLFRFGYGGTTCLVDSRSPVIKDAEYDYPYWAVEAHFMPYQPYLRLWASGAFLFQVEPSKDLEGGPYLGLKVAAGLDLIPLDNLYFGIGYEVVNFFDVKVNQEKGQDLYLAFFLRAGCSIH